MVLPGISREQMDKVDNLMVKRYNIPIELMMEHAGLNLARLILKFTTPLYYKNIIFIIGNGNNGGGGLVAARRLSSWGFNLEIFIPRGYSNLNMISQKHLHRIYRLTKKVKESLPNCPDTDNIYVDCYLGYNFKNREDKITENVFNFLQKCQYIISLDLPSGLEADTGKSYSKMCPVATLTLAFVKIGLIKARNKYVGDIFLSDIGVPKAIFQKRLNINWGSPYTLDSLNVLYSRFKSDSLQNIHIAKNYENAWMI